MNSAILNYYSSVFINKTFIFLHSHTLAFEYGSKKYKITGSLPPYFEMCLKKLLGEAYINLTNFMYKNNNE
jgi:hypothetical protein